MIIVTRPGTTPEQIQRIRDRVAALGIQTNLSVGTTRAVIGCIGDVGKLADLPLLAMAGVESTLPVGRPYKLASLAFAAKATEVSVGGPGGPVVGGAELAVIAGPCSVEGPDMLRRTADHVRGRGARLLRGGAFKPRTSPYAFQGLGDEGLELLAAVRAETGMPVVTEVMDPRDVGHVADHADVLQIGARNMQNYPLLREVGEARTPVLLKRGLSATIKELLLAAEYVLSRGNPDVILCERGIRTFATATRNTFDVGAVPVLKSETHLPVIVDPSHAAGVARYVAPLAFAGIAAGADGFIVEVHPEPAEALSDGNQALTFDAFEDLMDGVAAFASAAGRTLPPAVSAKA